MNYSETSKIYIALNNSPFYGGGVEQAVNSIINNFSDITLNKLILVCNDQKQPLVFHFGGVKCLNFYTKSNKYLDKLFLYSQLMYSYRIYRFLKFNLLDGDVVNVHGLEYSFFLSLLKINKKFKLIISAHGSYFRQYTLYVVERLPSKFFLLSAFFYLWRWYFYLIERLALKNADCLIFTTKKMELFFIGCYAVNQPCSIIPLGIPFLSDNSVSVVKKNVNKAIIVGSKTYLKGLDIAIKSVENLNKKNIYIELSVIGFDDFYDHFDKKKIPKFIKYIGRVNPKEVKKWFQESDFLIFPTRYESYGLVPLESILNKKPYIVSEASANAEINYSDFGIVVKNYSVYYWENAILKMIDNENYSFFMENIKKVDLAHFEWGNIAHKYEVIFNKYL